MCFLKKKGDQKTQFGPLGDQSPPKGTNVGAVNTIENHQIQLKAIRITSDTIKIQFAIHGATSI